MVRSKEGLHFRKTTNTPLKELVWSPPRMTAPPNPPACICAAGPGGRGCTCPWFLPREESEEEEDGEDEEDQDEEEEGDVGEPESPSTPDCITVDPQAGDVEEAEVQSTSDCIMVVIDHGEQPASSAPHHQVNQPGPCQQQHIANPAKAASGSAATAQTTSIPAVVPVQQEGENTPRVLMPGSPPPNIDPRLFETLQSLDLEQDGIVMTGVRRAPAAAEGKAATSSVLDLWGQPYGLW